MKILASVVFGVGLITLVIGAYYLFWPIIDHSGVIEHGEYRELRIGDSKGDVILTATSSYKGRKLKIRAYRGQNNKTVPVFSGNCADGLRESNTWFFSYASIHKEALILTFEDGVLTKIWYERNFLSA